MAEVAREAAKTDITSDDVGDIGKNENNVEEEAKKKRDAIIAGDTATTNRIDNNNSNGKNDNKNKINNTQRVTNDCRDVIIIFTIIICNI